MRCKTNPKQLQAEQEVDFEEEVAKYKRDINEDIQSFKRQEYREPQWIKDVLGSEAKSDNKLEETSGSRPNTSPSSSSWEQPISDSQAVQISDYILTGEEEQDFLSQENACEDSGQTTLHRTDEGTAKISQTLNTQAEETVNSDEEDTSPAWEQGWEIDTSPTYEPIPEENSGDFWETWLEEISQLPAPGYQPSDDLLRSPYYINQM